MLGKGSVSASLVSAAPTTSGADVRSSAPGAGASIPDVRVPWETHQMGKSVLHLPPPIQPAELLG